ncbi:MAG: hypothetical protein K2X81_28850, partial [Candidatus Obscuribacterales bacterium]|nr:hypothetical protein [Candidatus Obscuribacterales bacterium]
VAELAKARLSKQPIIMDKLIKAAVVEVRLLLLRRKISVSNNISKEQTLTGDTNPLRLLFKALLLTAIANCDEGDKINIECAEKESNLSFTLGTELGSDNCFFEAWRLGELRLIASHDQGIELAAIDAMARMQGGYLSVCTKLDKYSGYRLTFAS